jgi:hypothetical protein
VTLLDERREADEIAHGPRRASMMFRQQITVAEVPFGRGRSRVIAAMLARRYVMHREYTEHIPSAQWSRIAPS